MLIICIKTICRKLLLFHYETSKLEDLSSKQDKFHFSDFCIFEIIQNPRWLHKNVKTPIVWKTKSVWLLVFTINAYFLSQICQHSRARVLSWSTSSLQQKMRWQEVHMTIERYFEKLKRKMRKEAQPKITFSALSF